MNDNHKIYAGSAVIVLALCVVLGYAGHDPAPEPPQEATEVVAAPPVPGLAPVPSLPDPAPSPVAPPEEAPAPSPQKPVEPSEAPAPVPKEPPAPAPAPETASAVVAETPKPKEYANDIDGWLDEAADVLNSWGHDIDEHDKELLKEVSYYESGHNPSALNLWDINAINGVPSKGLMQTIPPTFEEYKLPGHDDIANPVDNIIAATQYMVGRYGGIENHPGLVSIASGGGYMPY